MVTVAQACKFPKKPWIVPLKWVSFMIHKIYLKQVVKKKAKIIKYVFSLKELSYWSYLEAISISLFPLKYIPCHYRFEKTEIPTWIYSNH